MAKDVFISYSHRDYKDANDRPIPGNIISTLKVFLESKGYSYWIDENGICSGDEFTTEIIDNILNSKVVLFVSTENSNKAKWTAREIAFASVNGKRIIPFRYDNSPFNKNVQFFLSTVDFIDYRRNPQQAMEKLGNALANILGHRTEVPTPNPEGTGNEVPFMEEFASYQFEPVTVTRQLRHPKLRMLSWALLLAGAMLIIGLGFCAMSWLHPVAKQEDDVYWLYNPFVRSKSYLLTGHCSKFYAKDYKGTALYYYRIEYFYMSAIMALLLCIDAAAYVLVYRHSSHGKDLRRLRQDADYIQDFSMKNGGYVFIAKDRKFGVYDTKTYRTVISPQYDQLQWARPNVMWAYQGSSRFLIDIFNNRLG